MDWLKAYGDTLGPLGFPQKDQQARELDALLKTLPKTPEYDYRRVRKGSATSELNAGERSDVSWISTETIDRMGEIVLAKGMNDSQFAANPIVPLNHNYYAPPVGRSLWRKRVKDGDLIGIKAKTKYPEKPENWGDDAWPSDKVFALVQAGLLNGKSIGFQPVKAHVCEAKEAVARGCKDGTLIFDEWMLMEYSCCSIPANPDSITEAVSKSLDLAGLLQLERALPAELVEAIKNKLATKKTPLSGSPTEPSLSKWTSLEEIERAIRSSMTRVDLEAIARRTVADVIQRQRGRV